MAYNLCCFLNSNTDKGSITCRDCDNIWECWCAWSADRTHRAERDFLNCPVTNKEVDWDYSVAQGAWPAYIQSRKLP